MLTNLTVRVTLPVAILSNMSCAGIVKFRNCPSLIPNTKFANWLPSLPTTKRNGSPL